MRLDEVFHALPDEHHADPESQLRAAMLELGIDPPSELYLDGQIHRFRNGKGSDKTGWYVVFADGIPAGRFGDWRAGVEQAFRANVGRTLTPAEEAALATQLAKARAARDAERERSRQVASDVSSDIWESAPQADPDHPYLRRKGIKPNGARVTGDGRLIVPLYSPDGTLSSVQYIGEDGTKLYHVGGQTGGCFDVLGPVEGASVVYIAEGFATAATIHEVTGAPAVVAYSASNLVPVTGTIREKIPGVSIVIVADHDRSGVGQRYAEQAAAKHGARYVMPPKPGDANDYAQDGGDLLALLSPPKSDWLIPADDFANQPAPIKWLVRRWVPQQALTMVFGPSGCGKSFLVLDWSLRIASGASDWFGRTITPGRVVYLAGEGHYGMRSRVAAWKTHHQPPSALNLWISESGCDLDKAEGYLRARDAIQGLGDPPALIVVDTLHRFMSGDENSAQDARTMVQSCAGLMREFGCSVILVHHTGASEEAQMRSRGSSAWKGTLESEICLVPSKRGPTKIHHLKAKDSAEEDPRYMDLESVAIPGWIDDDGEPVTSVIANIVPEPERESEPVDPSIQSELRRIWWDSGTEVDSGHPYLVRSFAHRWLRDQRMTEAAVKKRVLAYEMSGLIEPWRDGWRVTEPILTSAMLLEKSS
jgi:putative DNA primase/helicase